MRLSVAGQGMRRKCREHCRFDFRAIERTGFDLLYHAFSTDAGGCSRNEQQVASAARNQCPEPCVELDGAGWLRSILLAKVVQLVDDAVDFRDFIHANPLPSRSTQGRF